MSQDSKNSFLADFNCTTQSLPPGTQFVKLHRPDKNPISVKLPKTDPIQNWCTINVESEDHSVKCPNSGVALKTKMLKKVVYLANDENNNIIIPISAGGEVRVPLSLGKGKELEF